MSTDVTDVVSVSIRIVRDLCITIHNVSYRIVSYRTVPYRTVPYRTGPDRTGPDRTGPDRTGPDRTGPDRTGPDRTGPDRTGPDRTGPYHRIAKECFVPALVLICISMTELLGLAPNLESPEVETQRCDNGINKRLPLLSVHHLLGDDVADRRIFLHCPSA